MTKAYWRQSSLLPLGITGRPKPPPHTRRLIYPLIYHREPQDYPSEKLSVDTRGPWQRGNGAVKSVLRCVSVRRRGGAAGSWFWD